MTPAFLAYLTTTPLEIEIYGHFEFISSGQIQRPLIEDKKSNLTKMSSISGSLRSLGKSSGVTPSSTNVANILQSPPRPTQADWIRHDILAIIQIRELSLNGDYVPVRAESVGGHSIFMLTQGVQRRIDVTLSHESGDDLRWERVVDMQVGQIHRDGELTVSAMNARALSLDVLPWFISQGCGDER